MLSDEDGEGDKEEEFSQKFGDKVNCISDFSVLTPQDSIKSPIRISVLPKSSKKI